MTNPVTPGENLDAPILDVEHAKLKPVSAEALWARFCPACGVGLLCCPRSNATLELQEFDRCLLCAQRVRFTDAAQMRARDI